MRPCVGIQPGVTLTLAEVDGPGAVQQIWMTLIGTYRFSILRFYWDGEETPSVEVPIGDFFASAYTNFNIFRPIKSLPVCVNPGNAFNCYWEMPFRKHCRITLENIGIELMTIYYQINYTLTDIPADAAYFHAQFRRTNPLAYKEVYTILDGVRGQGHYVGTYMAWQVNNNGWWGEGEIKFYLDGDLPDGLVDRNVKEHGGECYPTLCGTGTEDYFCGSYNFEDKGTKLTESSRPSMPVCRTSSAPMDATNRTPASAFTAGTSWTRCDSNRIWAWPSSRWAGAPAGVTCPTKTT